MDLTAERPLTKPDRKSLLLLSVMVISFFFSKVRSLFQCGDSLVLTGTLRQRRGDKILIAVSNKAQSIIDQPISAPLFSLLTKYHNLYTKS